jgi:uncharacterized protein DUF2760
VSTASVPLATRLWFAWLCFFKVLFDGRFAARAWDARDAHRLPPPTGSGRSGSPAAGSRVPDLESRVANSGALRDSVSSAASTTAALQLLSLLQSEGRLVDFLQQDVAAFSDADVGIAARVVHEGCRRALRAHASVEPVRPEGEGQRITLAAGFDADAVKLVGDVRGQPPYVGVLRHRGWRVLTIELPQRVGDHDPRIVAPAEVELG